MKYYMRIKAQQAVLWLLDVIFAIGSVREHRCILSSIKGSYEVTISHFSYLVLALKGQEGRAIATAVETKFHLFASLLFSEKSTVGLAYIFANTYTKILQFCPFKIS